MLAYAMAAQPTSPVPLTRKEFYDLTVYCRTYAADLARFDQHRVNLKECNRFNTWLTQVKRYDKLNAALRDLAPARPIARWQIMVLLARAVGDPVVCAARPRRSRPDGGHAGRRRWARLSSCSSCPSPCTARRWNCSTPRSCAWSMPCWNCSTTASMDFTEAVYFRAKENLTAAREELRLQIDLAHR